MGTTSTKLFSDDTAQDVRDYWKDHLAKTGSAKQATEATLKKFRSDIKDSDEGPVVWLALAVTEHKHGYKTSAVEKQARKVLAKKRGLDLYKESGNRSLAARLKEYESIRKLLDSPRPTPRVIKKHKPLAKQIAPLVFRKPGTIFRVPLPTLSGYAYFKTIHADARSTFAVLLNYRPPNSKLRDSWQNMKSIKMRASDSIVRDRNERRQVAAILNTKSFDFNSASIVGNAPLSTAERKLQTTRSTFSLDWADLGQQAEYSFDQSTWISSAGLVKRLRALSVSKVGAFARKLLVTTPEVQKPLYELHEASRLLLVNHRDYERALVLRLMLPDSTNRPSTALAYQGLGQVNQANAIWQTLLAQARTTLQRETLTKMQTESIAWIEGHRKQVPTFLR